MAYTPPNDKSDVLNVRIALFVSGTIAFVLAATGFWFVSAVVAIGLLCGGLLLMAAAAKIESLRAVRLQSPIIHDPHRLRELWPTIVVSYVGAIAIAIGTGFIALALQRRFTSREHPSVASRQASLVAPESTKLSELRRELRLCQNLPILSGWGGENCSATVNGTALMEYAENYRVAVACGIDDKTKDRFQDSIISITPSYTIREGDIPIVSPLSVAMSQEVNKEAKSLKQAAQKAAKSGINSTWSISFWYETLLIPKEVKMSDIHTLNDVPRLGGLVLHDIPTGHRGAREEHQVP